MLKPSNHRYLPEDVFNHLGIDLGGVTLRSKHRMSVICVTMIGQPQASHWRKAEQCAL